MLEAYLLFYQFLLKVFINLNLLLQREGPLISRVHGHIIRFLKKLELLKHAEVINWEHRKDVTIDSITYFVQR